jgi:hypothetical protein
VTGVSLKHATVTVLLFGLLVLIPFVSQTTANFVLVTAMTISAWLVGDRGRRMAIAMVSIGGVAICISILEAVHPGIASAMVHPRVGWVLSVVLLILLLYCACIVVISLLKATDVSIDEVAGAINVYLIIAFLWANAYHLVERGRPGSFSFPQSMTDTFPSLVYFSIVTLTTLGYGDIIPQSPTARVLVSLEAIVGQIYVPVVVGYLLSLHISRKLSRTEDG